jgi:hypothetical protein
LVIEISLPCETSPRSGREVRYIAFLSAASLVLWLGHAESQQEPPAPQNPYLKGSEGYGKGPRGLTSFQPIAIDQPFAARMAADVDVLWLDQTRRAGEEAFLLAFRQRLH